MQQVKKKPIVLTVIVSVLLVIGIVLDVALYGFLQAVMDMMFGESASTTELTDEEKEEIKARITKDYGIAPEDVESTRRYYNKKRAGYFRANTGNDWSNLKNYDVVLDSSKLGIEGCVNVLKGLF